MFQYYWPVWDEQPTELSFLLLLPVFNGNETDCGSPAPLCTRPFLQWFSLRPCPGCVSSLSPCESLGLCLDRGLGPVQNSTHCATADTSPRTRCRLMASSRKPATLSLSSCRHHEDNKRQKSLRIFTPLKIVVKTVVNCSYLIDECIVHKFTCKIFGGVS